MRHKIIKLHDIERDTLHVKFDTAITADLRWLNWVSL